MRKWYHIGVKVESQLESGLTSNLNDACAFNIIVRVVQPPQSRKFHEQHGRQNAFRKGRSRCQFNVRVTDITAHPSLEHFFHHVAGVSRPQNEPRSILMKQHVWRSLQPWTELLFASIVVLTSTYNKCDVPPCCPSRHSRECHTSNKSANNQQETKCKFLSRGFTKIWHALAWYDRFMAWLDPIMFCAPAVVGMRVRTDRRRFGIQLVCSRIATERNQRGRRRGIGTVNMMRHDG